MVALTTGSTGILDRKVALVINPSVQSTIDRSRSGLIELPLVLMPGHRALLVTQEEVEVPTGHVGQVELRSTFARLGLILPPTYADPCFKGTLTLEVFNANLNPVLIEAGVHFAEMVIVPAPEEPDYVGRYQGQGADPVPAKALVRSHE